MTYISVGGREGLADQTNMMQIYKCIQGSHQMKCTLPLRSGIKPHVNLKRTTTFHHLELEREWEGRMKGREEKAHSTYLPHILSQTVHITNGKIFIHT